MIHYRIAAAIPTHNRLNDLREAITSVLEQRVEIEIIEHILQVQTQRAASLRIPRV